jgi:hypothetical protein
VDVVKRFGKVQPTAGLLTFESGKSKSCRCCHVSKAVAIKIREE